MKLVVAGMVRLFKERCVAMWSGRNGGRRCRFMELMIWTIASAVVLFGVALLLHVRKEAKDAHGKERK